MGKPIAGRGMYPFNSDGYVVTVAVLHDGTKVDNIHINKQRSHIQYDLITKDESEIFTFMDITGLDKNGLRLNLNSSISELKDALAPGTFCVKVFNKEHKPLGYAIKFLYNKSSIYARGFVFDGIMNEETIELTNLVLSPDSIEMVEGDKTTLNYTLTPPDASTNLVWSSNKPQIASVASGVVTAIKEGLAEISLVDTNTNITATSSITVKSKIIDVTAVNVTPSTGLVNIGKTLSLSAEVLPVNATVKTVVWKSSNTTIATVDNGIVTAIKDGQVDITATSNNGVIGKSVITVTDNKIIVEPKVYNIKVDESSQVSFTTSPNTYKPKFESVSSDPTVVEITNSNEDGLVEFKGLKKGTSTITLSDKDDTTIKDSCVVNVEVLVNSVTLSKNTLEMDIGDTEQLTVVVLPDDANNKEVEWNFTGNSITVVDGLVTAKSAGTSTITVTSTDGSAKSATCVVTVNGTVEKSVSFDEKTVSLNVGDSKDLTYTVTPSSYVSEYTLTSNNLAAVVVNGETITAIGKGTATITITDNNDPTITDTCTVTAIQQADSITITPKSFELEVGKDVLLTPAILPNDTNDKTVSWESSDNSIATVVDGKVTGVLEGDVTITARTSNGKTDTATGKIVTARVVETAITVTPNTLSLEKDETKQLEVSFTPDNTTDKTVTWTSSRPATATVSDDGLVTGVSSGQSTITCKSASGKTSTCVVSVVIKATELRIEPDEATMEDAHSKKMAAIILPADATIKKVKEWVSEDPEIVSIASVPNDTECQISSRKPGVTKIIATHEDGLRAEAVITVVPYDVIKVTITPATASINMDETVQLSAAVSPASATYRDVVWSSEDETIATVDESGLVTSVASGSVNIKAVAHNGITGVCALTVKPPFVAVESLAVTPKDITLQYKGKGQLYARFTPPNATNQGVTWSSSSAVVKVSSTGELTGSNPGTAIVTARSREDSTILDTSNVKVMTPKMFDINLNEDAIADIDQGEVAQFIIDGMEDHDIEWNVIENPSHVQIEQISRNIWDIEGLKSGIVKIAYKLLDGLDETNYITINITKD